MKTLKLLVATGLALTMLVGVTLALTWWRPGAARAEDAVSMPDTPDAPYTPAALQTLPQPWLSDDDVADAPYSAPNIWPPPAIDGLIAPGEYAHAGKVTFPGYGGDVEVFFRQDAITLYVAFELPDKVNQIPVPHASLYLDTNNDGGSAPQTDDFWFRVWRNGGYGGWQGNGSGWNSTPLTWTFGYTETMSGWSVEFGISFTQLGISAGTFKVLGLALDNGGIGPEYYWPAGATPTQPDTWGSLVSSSDWGTFYWKPGPWEDYAPSGMPDFDQRQDQWSSGPVSTHCGPVAMANSLWWFDSKFETPDHPPPPISDTYRLVKSYGDWDDHDISNTVPLVDDLANNYFGTNQGITGTSVISMFLGTQQYLRDRGLWDDYIVTLVISPSFEWVADEVMRSEDVILLLGFYEENPPGSGNWVRVGGHYVTAAGVDPVSQTIAFSDPFVDNAEGGGMGRVLSGMLTLPHPLGHSTATLHNDAGNVSHDAYTMTKTTSPGGTWGPGGYPWWLFSEPWFFSGVNPHPFIETWPWTGGSIQVEVEFALTVSPFDWKSSGEWLPDEYDPVWGTWQPWIDYAPNGVPDFDQKQDCWGTLPCPPMPPTQYTFCGPAAAGNSLWWFDSKFEPDPITPTVPTSNDNYPLVQSYDPAGVWDDHDPLNVDGPAPWPAVDGLVEDLALYFQTDVISSGTIITNMYQGIEQYLIDHNLREGYVITQVKSPEFWWVAEEVEVSEDVILLLGFWEQVGSDYWKRLGGHYVTIPGVDKQGGLVAFSDPYYDGAEYWWPYAYPGGWPTVMGRVADGWLTPHPPYFTHPATTHNDAGNVSHDVYYITATNSPGGVWGPVGYVESWDGTFERQNGGGEDYTSGPIQTEVDWAIAVSPVADVWVSKSVTPTTVMPGDWVTFTIQFGNVGSLPAENVVITDVLPAGLTNASYTYTLNYTGTLVSHDTYTWSVGTLKWMEGGTITVTTQVETPGEWLTDTVITNTVTITTTSIEQYQVTQYANTAQAAFTATLPPHDWRKWVNSVEWYAGITVTVETSDTIEIVDVISTSYPFTLTEAWDSAHLSLTTYAVEPLVGLGDVITGAGWLTWTASGYMTLTKQFHVEPCTWTQTILEEGLYVRGALVGRRPITIDKMPPDLHMTSDYQTEVTSGRSATFTLFYSNTGGYENDVWITNTFPISAPFASSIPSPTAKAPDGTWASWGVGDLATIGSPGSIEVTVTVAGGITPCTWITITDWIYDHVGYPAGGVTTTFHVNCAAVTSVNLVITNSGTIYTDTVLHFSADVLPDNATKPYSYTTTTDGVPGSVMTSTADPLLFTDTFAITGTHAVTIAAWNCDMSREDAVTGAITFTVYAPGVCVDLAGVTIHGPISGTPGIYTFTTSYEPADATTPISYTWDDVGSADTSVRSLGVGVHTLTVTATNCTNTVVTDTHVITISAAPVCTQVTGVDLTLLTSTPIYTNTNVQFSANITPDDATRPYTYTVDYGDGISTTATSSDDPLTDTLDHTFTSTGTFIVEIGVWNCSMTASQAITSTAVVTVSEQPVCESVNITDLTSDSPLEVGQAMHFTATVAGSTPITYTWDFGDGTPEQSGLGLSVVSYTYAAAGTYTVTLDVENDCPSTGTHSITVTVNPPPPELAWEKEVYVNGVLTDATPITVFPSDTVEIVDRVWVTYTGAVTFTLVETWTGSLELTSTVFVAGSVVSGVNSLTWEATGVASNTWHVLTKTFLVTSTGWFYGYVTETLWVEDAAAQPGDRLLIFAEGGVCLPVNILGLTSDSPLEVGQAMHFTATVAGSTSITYTWDFGDGTPEQSGLGLSVVSYTYAAAGTYTVTLDVENDCPSTDTRSITVTVNPPPCVEVTGVTLAITNTGTVYTDTVVHFSADVAPDDAAKPYTYTVDYGSGPIAPDTATADPFLFTHTFPITGTCTITFAAWNCAMTVPESGSVSVTVSAYGGQEFIYLPLVMRNYP